MGNKTKPGKQNALHKISPSGTITRVNRTPLISKGLTPWKHSVEALIVMVFALGLYVNTLQHRYALDDMMMITHNQFTKEGVSSIGKILTTDAFVGFHGEDKNLLPGGRYRPLSQIMFAIEYELFGENPLPGHLLNVLLYALGCVLLYRALLLLFRHEVKPLWKLSFPLMVVLLFTVHPLHTEGVANIKGRDEILGLITFAVGAILALQYVEKPSLKRLIWIPPVFFLALISKESALTYFAAIPLLVLYKKKGFSKQLWMVAGALLAGIVLYLILRLGAIGFPTTKVMNTELLNDPFLYASGTERLATIFYTWIRYVGLILFPHPLTHDYYPWHITYKTFAHPMVLLSVLLFAGGAILSLRQIRKPGIPATGFLLFVILFSSQSNLLVNIGIFMNERFVFLALLGVLMIVVWALSSWLPQKLKTGTVVPMALFLILVVAFSLKTISRNGAWKDDFTLFSTDVKTSVNSAKVNVSVGGNLFEQARDVTDEETRNALLQKALPYLRRGTELHPRYIQGQILYGNVLMMLNSFTDAYQAYDACLRTNPSLPDALLNAKALGRRASLFRDYPSLEVIYAGLLRYQPNDREIVTGYAEALMYNLRTDAALGILDSLYRIDQDDVQVNQLLGQVYGRYKSMEQGVSQLQFAQYMRQSLYHLQKAADLEPENYGIVENLAIAYGMLGDFKQAIRYFTQALDALENQKERLTSQGAALRLYNENRYRIHRNIGDTYRNMSNAAKFLEHYQEAYQYNSSDASLATTISRLWLEQGNPNKAREVLMEFLQRNPENQQAAAMARSRGWL